VRSTLSANFGSRLFLQAPARSNNASTEMKLPNGLRRAAIASDNPISLVASSLCFAKNAQPAKPPTGKVCWLWTALRHLNFP
jgi:hypothetical protein